MASTREDLSLQQGWLHQLAQAEVHPDAEKLLEIGNRFDPQQLVEESAIQFLAELRETCSEYARVFNSYSDTGAKFQEIKIYAVAQSNCDFMFYRNQIKLIFSNPAQGLIQISFSQHMRGTLAVDHQGHRINDKGPLPEGAQAQELLAQVGPFRDVHWTFQGETVTPAQVARFYFFEFTRLTRDTKPSRRGNQILIDQIKALLQQKGLDL